METQLTPRTLAIQSRGAATASGRRENRASLLFEVTCKYQQYCAPDSSDRFDLLSVDPSGVSELNPGSKYQCFVMFFTLTAKGKTKHLRLLVQHSLRCYTHVYLIISFKESLLLMHDTGNISFFNEEPGKGLTPHQVFLPRTCVLCLCFSHVKGTGRNNTVLPTL